MCRAWGVFDVGAAVVGNAAKKLQRHPVEAGSRDPDTHDVIGGIQAYGGLNNQNRVSGPTMLYLC